MKDVAACDKPRGGGKQPLIRGCPNGETYPALSGMPKSGLLRLPDYRIRGGMFYIYLVVSVIRIWEHTWGIETS